MYFLLCLITGLVTTHCPEDDGKGHQNAGLVKTTMYFLFLFLLCVNSTKPFIHK